MDSQQLHATRYTLHATRYTLHATRYTLHACSETYLLFLLMGSCVFLVCLPVCLPSSVSGPPLIWGVCFSSSSTSSWQDKYLQYILYSLVKLLKVILTISPCSHNFWINKYTAFIYSIQHSSVSSLLTITEINRMAGDCTPMMVCRPVPLTAWTNGKNNEKSSDQKSIYFYIWLQV